MKNLWSQFADKTKSKQKSKNPKWTMQLIRPYKPDFEITEISDIFTKPLSKIHSTKGLRIRIQCVPMQRFTTFSAEITSANVKSDLCYLALRCQWNKGEGYSFLGKVTSLEIFRQSPHDPNDYIIDIAKQPVPMIAIKTDFGFMVAVSETPAFFANYTTQKIDPKMKIADLCSGDSGKFPKRKLTKSKVEVYYHRIKPDQSYTFKGIIFRSLAQNLPELRQDVFEAIASHWGQFSDRLGAIAFASNYMHLRSNETKNSRYWVCPGIEYSNKQYTRDAFWQSLILPLEMEQECYDHEATTLTQGAERPLIALIWTYRIKRRGGIPNYEAAKTCLQYIEAHVCDGLFYSNNDPKIKDFQSWYDLCAFDDDDVVSYNQGLLCVALLSAEKLGLPIPSSVESAIENYRNLFNTEKGYFPLSRKKDIVCIDAFVGDLLARVYLAGSLLEQEIVRLCYQTYTQIALTDYGFKITCDYSGEYVKRELYSTADFRSRQCDIELGSYANGGSYYLFDMLFLIDCYLNGIVEAEELIIWRTCLEFERGGTYHEHINTITGEMHKANHGWNGAIYTLWRELIEQGKADDRFFREINKSKR
ncbi:hypothetical protein ACFL27_13570 [candidate division CSSED10-310 bacterium]|uniref:Alpha-L-rhamnosidase six-hairpin glycosidase domain-containing protein n=1 Tax=candidate division CSSED10-310 bacterium TaxID=2855610 RepID=A0ABV6YYF1_UNCC1